MDRRHKQPFRVVLRYSETMQQIYRRTPMPKCDFNKIAFDLYWNHTSSWVFSRKYAAYIQKPLEGCFWGDKIELVIWSALIYKTKSESDGKFWESKRAKYETIRETRIRQYPENNCEKFLIKEKINKEWITTKLKERRTGKKKLHRRSGGGRVVFTFHDICESLRKGYPAANGCNPYGKWYWFLSSKYLW